VRFEEGVLQRMMTEVGFEDIEVNDLSTNVMPMVRLFFILAYLPYLIVKFFGLESYFINTVAAVQMYQLQGYCRYVAVSGKKPLVSEKITSLRERKK
jgi:sterol 24-C-methyltransferase